MADWSELKRLIDRLKSLEVGDSAEGDTWEAALEEYEDFLERVGWDSQTAILILISENERLQSERDAIAKSQRYGQDTVAITVERDQLRAEVEALRRDAERYRWLRSVENDVAITFGAHAWEDLSDEYMDAAIDAAIGDGGRTDG